MLQELSYAQWQEYEREGFLRLGRCLTDDELAAMQQRMDDIMLGTAPVDYDRMMMQLDRIPGKTDEPGPGTKGHKGPTLFYRKIQELEFDPLFLRYMQKPPLPPYLLHGVRRRYVCRLYARHVHEQARRRRHAPRLAPGPLDQFRPRPADHHLDRARPGHRRQRLRLHRPPPPSRP